MVYEGVVWFERVAHQVFIGPTLRHPARLIGSVNLFCGARRVHRPLGAKGRLLEPSRFCPPGCEPRFLRLHRPCPWRLKFWWQRIIPPPWHHASMPMLHGRFPRVCSSGDSPFSIRRALLIWKNRNWLLLSAHHCSFFFTKLPSLLTADHINFSTKVT